MTAPPLTSTYRLQLHQGFDFEAARAILPYLVRLGISHVYLSPVVAARPGSTHGYDVADPRCANPELGGDGGFRVLTDAAHALGLGVIVDIVPNHMGTGVSNPFWMDVLRWGRDSLFANVFDIEWDRPGREGLLVLPVLGEELETVLERGELTLATRDGEPRLVYYEHEWPVDPRTAHVTDLRALLHLQNYRLVHWRRAATEINYRRFFDIGELAAVRVEDPAVFDITHRWTLERIADGSIDGLRIDHIDGLRDPSGYLQRLRAEVDARRPGESLPIFVEKILSPGESLRTDWPCDGTTGYEYLNLLESVFVEPVGLTIIEAGYRRLLRIPPSRDFHDVAVRGKEHVLRHFFDTDVRRLVRCLSRAARGVAPRLPRPMLHEAVVQIAAELPVYRTYVTEQGEASADDYRWIGEALARAQRRGGPDRFALQFVADALRGEVKSPDAREFAMRFQQTSGPATAKGVEDTALYRWFPLASLNEVGGEPARPLDDALGTLHAANTARLARWPRSMLAADTHDTKRSADVRARLDALSEIPRDWVALVARWRRRHAPLHHLIAHRAAPDANAEYLLYQTLVGVWPIEVPNVHERAALLARVTEYMRKAAREAKAQTSWTERDAQYEAALDAFIAALVTGAEGALFRDELSHLVRRVGRAGEWTSLARTAVHATSPGAPDTYQGTESWSLSLVDPDNRRPVDYPALAHDESAKQRLLATILRLRRERPAAFAAGSEYVPLQADGDHAAHVIAFARRGGGHTVMTVAARWPLRLCPDGAMPVGRGIWGDTRIVSPTGEPLFVGDVLATSPAAVLATWRALDRPSRRRRA